MKINCAKTCDLCDVMPPIPTTAQPTTTKKDDGDETGDCKDTNSLENCTYWRDQSLCSGGEWDEFMKINCAKTCDLCDVMPPIPTTAQPTTTKKDDGDETGDCKDTNSLENCTYWRDQSLCSGGQWDEFMKINCAKTCDLCDVMPPIPTTAQPTTTKKDDGDETGNCDDNVHCCEDFAKSGFCTKYQSFMSVECKRSCGLCGDCKDTNSLENCTYWKDQNHCSGGQWDEFMKINCAKTCNLCDVMPPIPTTAQPTTTKKDDGDCEDENTSCQSWASRGECQKNPDYMLESCKKSCQQC